MSYSEPPPVAEAGGLAAGFTGGVPERPEPGAVDLEPAALAIDANAAVAADGVLVLGGGEGLLAAGLFSGFGGVLGGHVHHLRPGAAPEAQG